MSNGIPAFITQINEIAAGFQNAQILFTALEGGVFAQLSAPKSADGVAAALGWNAKGTRMLLDGLLALELVEKEAGMYRNGPAAAACLVPGAPHDQIHIMRHRAHGWAAWSRLQEAVAQGSGVMREQERNPEELRDFICGMDDIARESARELLGVLDCSSNKKLLDVGGGPASYTIAFLKHFPEMQATLFDLPDVTEIAREQLEKEGLVGRVQLVQGDMTVDPLPGGHDLVLISNIIHSFDAEMNQILMHKCYDALVPGGTLVVKDFLVEDDRSGPAFGLIFALHMLVHTEAGDTYSKADVASWTTAAGFEAGELLDLTPQTRLWVVKKPE